jgi:hypothetical protein
MQEVEQCMEQWPSTSGLLGTATAFLSRVYANANFANVMWKHKLNRLLNNATYRIIKKIQYSFLG